MNIKYYHNDIQDPLFLGKESYSGITQKIIPAFKKDSPPTITKYFEGTHHNKWEVINISKEDDSNTAIILSPREHADEEESLYETYKNNKKVLKSLQFGSLVEVDYGYKQYVRTSDGRVSYNERYPDYIQQGEMHKRRLSIVLKAYPDKVQVIPITSKEPKNQGDKSIFQISEDSLSKLSGYTSDDEAPAFALCHMIQTISTHRIIAPKSYQTGTYSPFRDINYRLKLNRNDTRLLEIAISHSVNLGDHYELKRDLTKKSAEVSSLKKEVERLSLEMQSLNELVESKGAIEIRLSAATQVLADYRQNTSKDNREDAMRHSNELIDQHVELLEEINS